MTSIDEEVLRRNYSEALQELERIRKEEFDIHRANERMLQEIKDLNARIAFLENLLLPLAQAPIREGDTDIDATCIMVAHVLNARAALNWTSPESEATA